MWRVRRAIAAVKKLFGMKRSIHLFLNEQEVEFKTIPDILYNFRVDDLQSPAAVKNNYSKTVTIPLTKKNSRIFQGYTNADRSGGTFSPSKKIPFSLYLDAELFETGYARLDKIKQNKDYSEADITLFGGLGDFFYGLDTDDNGKRKLSSLDFYAGEEATEPLDLGFTISAGTVAEAWSEIDGYSSKWRCINFAETYDGLPSDFSSDKMLINTSGYTGDKVVSGATSGTSAYTTYNGYVMADLKREYTSQEVREFRSWQMRPVLHVQHVLEAISRPENNGGWEVAWDSDWARYDNPYWSQMWVTLPKLSEIKLNTASAGDETTNHTYTTKRAVTFNHVYTSIHSVEFTPDLQLSTANVKITFDFKAQSTHTNITSDLYSAAIVNGERCCNAWAVRLVAFAGDSWRSGVIAQSPVAWITSKIGDDFVHPNETLAPQELGEDFQYEFGKMEFNGSTGSTYEFKFDKQITLNMAVPNEARSYGLNVYAYANMTSGTSYNGQPYVTYGNRQCRYYTAQNLPSTGATNSCELIPQNGNLDGTAVATLSQSTAGYTGAQLTKQLLLDGTPSPFEFLVSYAKMFGLYFLKDPVKKKINILTRKNFFERDNVTDIEKYIDRTSVEINPLSFKEKFYVWRQEPVESSFEQTYETSYNSEYGIHRQNTGYEFNADEKDVLQGNCFKSAIQVLEKSPSFYSTGDDTNKPWMYDGFSYNLFRNKEPGQLIPLIDYEDTYEITVNRSLAMDAGTGQGGYAYYDLFDKACLHGEDNSAIDASNVLLLRQGDKELVAPNTELKWYITDDLREMAVLADGNPTWLYTNCEYDRSGNKIAIRQRFVPYFTRFVSNDISRYILQSLSFGKPKEIYVPSMVYREGATIFSYFWKDYIEEVISDDSRVMKTKMLFKARPDVNCLRRFYWFDNSLWRMLSISDWDAANDKLATVEFIKVRDISKYTSKVPSGEPEIELTLSQYEIGYTGGTINFTVSISDGGPWYLEHNLSDSDFSALSGVGNYTGTVNIPANGSGGSIEWWIAALVDGGGASDRKTIVEDSQDLAISMVWNGDVPQSGATMPVNVVSDAPWTAASPYNWVTLSKTTGTGNDTFSCTWGYNDSPYTREAYLTIRTDNRQSRSSALRQNGDTPPYMILSPDYNIDEFPASGGTLTFNVISTDVTAYWAYLGQAWSTFPNGNSSWYSNTMSIPITIEPNTTGASRYVWFEVWCDDPRIRVSNRKITQLG